MQRRKDTNCCIIKSEIFYMYWYLTHQKRNLTRVRYLTDREWDLTRTTNTDLILLHDLS